MLLECFVFSSLWVSPPSTSSHCQEIISAKSGFHTSCKSQTTYAQGESYMEEEACLGAGVQEKGQAVSPLELWPQADLTKSLKINLLVFPWWLSGSKPD